MCLIANLLMFIHTISRGPPKNGIKTVNYVKFYSARIIKMNQQTKKKVCRILFERD